MSIRPIPTLLMLSPLLLLLGADPATQPAGAERTTPSGLKIVEIKTLTDAMVAQVGDTVWVHYSGHLLGAAAEFDSSFKRGEPISFTIGTPGIIQGWQEGIQGMKVGEKRQLTIPPDIGYGAAGRPPVIPPNSTMVFDVQLVGIYRK